MNSARGWLARSLFVALALAASAGAARASWTLRTFDPTVNSGWSASLRIGALPGTVDDMVGVGHVAYWAAGIGFVYYDGVSFDDGARIAPPKFDQAELINVPTAALALDLGTEPWIARATLNGDQNDTGTLVVHHRAGGVWSDDAFETIQGEPAIDIDRASSTVYVFARTTTGGVFHWRDGGGWHGETFDTLLSAATLRVDRAGRPCLAYVRASDGAVGFATRVANAWQGRLVDGTGGAAGVALAFSGLGHPRILYGLVPTGQSAPLLHYAEENLGAWSSQLVAPPGVRSWDFSLAVGGGDVPFVAYHDVDGDNLRAAIRPSGTWDDQLVDGLVTGGLHPSIGIDGSNTPQIAYQSTYGVGARIATGSALVGVAPRPAVGTGLRIVAAAPNPVRAGTALAVTLVSPRAGQVGLVALDVRGRTLGPARSYAVAAGPNALRWDAPAAAGLVFLCAVDEQAHAATARVVVLD